MAYEEYAIEIRHNRINGSVGVIYPVVFFIANNIVI